MTHDTFTVNNFCMEFCSLYLDTIAITKQLQNKAVKANINQGQAD